MDLSPIRESGISLLESEVSTPKVQSYPGNMLAGARSNYDPGSLMASALARSAGDILAGPASPTSRLTRAQVQSSLPALPMSVPLPGSSEHCMVGLSHSLPGCSPSMVRELAHSKATTTVLRSTPRPTLPATWTPDHHQSISVRSHHLLSHAKHDDALDAELYESSSGLPMHEYIFILVASSVGASSLSFMVDEVASIMGSSHKYISDHTDKLGVYLLALFNFCLAVIARLIVRTNAQAEGSGIPEVKTMLFGQVKMVKEFLKFRVLVVKTVGLAMIVSAGLPIGKEGPFVHLASCITANIYPNFFEKTSGTVFPFLLASVAVGVGTTFSAPLGGVIFALELMLPQVYDMTSYLGCFVASVVGSIVFTVLKTAASGSKGKGLVALMSSDVKPGEGVSQKMPLVELLFYCFLGLVCGTLGGTFIKAHAWTQGQFKQWRMRGSSGQASDAHHRSANAERAALQKPLLGSNAPEGPSWAAESSNRATTVAASVSLWCNCCSRICKRFRGFQWRDIIQVGIIALVNTALSENIPMLAGGKTMPAFLVNLFSKDFQVDTLFGLSDELSMLLIFLMKWVMTILALSLPTPTGVVAPTMVIGAVIGQCFYVVIPEWVQEMLLEDGTSECDVHCQRKALGARFAIVGAAAFCSAVTRAFSMAITVFEVLALPGSVLPLSCASLLAMWSANHVSPSFFDQILINKGFFGIWAMSSSAKAMMPASKVMRRYTDYHTHCISYRSHLCDLERVLHESRETTFPIVQRVRDHSHLKDFDAETREWDLPLLVGTVPAKLVQEVLAKHYNNWNPHTIVDWLDPRGFSDEQLQCIMRTPLHVDANTAVKDVFLLWKVMNTSPEAEPVVYVTDKGHLLGVIRGEELVGKKV